MFRFAVFFSILISLTATICVSQTDGQKTENDFMNESHKLSNERKPLEAIAVLNRGLNVLPSAYWFYFRIAELYGGIGDKPKMEQAIEAGVENAPESERYNAIIRATNVLTGVRQCQKSVDMLQAAILQYPDERRPSIGLASAYDCLGDKVRALSEVNQYIVTVPEGGMGISYRNKLLAEIGGQEPDAETNRILIEVLEARLKAEPDNLRIKNELNMLLFRRARFYEKEERFDEMFADFDRTVELIPNSSTFLRRGGILLRYKFCEKAAADFEASIKDQDNVALIYVYRGDAYLCLERPEEALRDYEKAREMGGFPLEILEKKITELKAKILPPEDKKPNRK